MPALFETGQWSAFRKNSSTETLLGQVPMKLWKVDHVIKNEQTLFTFRPIKER